MRQCDYLFQPCTERSCIPCLVKIIKRKDEYIATLKDKTKQNKEDSVRYLITFGAKHPDFSMYDFDIIQQIKKLSILHANQCRNLAQGRGYIRGKFYAQNVPHPAFSKEVPIFNYVIGEIEKNINTIIQANPQFRVEYLRQSRGVTVSLFYQKDAFPINWGIF